MKNACACGGNWQEIRKFQNQREERQRSKEYRQNKIASLQIFILKSVPAPWCFFDAENQLF